jgi:two-component system chemotaxis response regulator CheY
MKNPKRILLVDDLKLARTVLKKILKSLGYTEIEEAHDGQEAYQKILAARESATPFDFVIIDWNMPKMSGLDVVKNCKTDESLSAISFIMVSAELEPRNIEVAMSAGVACYVQKPFTEVQLIEKISKLLPAVVKAA